MSNPNPPQAATGTPRTDAILPLGAGANSEVQHIAIELAGLARQLELELSLARNEALEEAVKFALWWHSESDDAMREDCADKAIKHYNEYRAAKRK